MRFKGFILRTAALVSAIVLSHAAQGQSKAIGANFSFTGIGISYEHYLEDKFIEVSLKSETSEMFLYRNDVPGFSAGVTWNFILKEWISYNGNRMSFFAGPGVTAGYACDFNSIGGVFCGLKGRAGIECSFSRNIILSASITPIIGAHLKNDALYMTMKPYWNGLIYTLLPEIGIKYGF